MDGLQAQIKKTIEHIKNELAGIRGGRAHPALIEEVKVNAYDSEMRLRELAAITIPEAKMLEVRVWDINIVDAVAAALERSDLGTSPSVAGEVIRIALPPLTEERRVQLTRLIGTITEDGRISLRRERDAELDKLKQMKTSGNVSEDEFFKQKEDIEGQIKDANKEIEEMKVAKESELADV